MIKFCQFNKLRNAIQYGFGDTMTCINAIVAITDIIRDVIEKKMTGRACSFDLQKAFDNIDNTILLKSEKIGFEKLSTI